MGDSITYLSRPAIDKALGGWQYTIEAKEGKTIANMTPLMESKIIRGSDGPPHSLFVNLGTNDIVHRNRTWLSSWDTLMADTSHTPCLVLFTINRFADAYSRPGDPKAEDVNRAIAAAHDADPSRVHVIDWNAAVLANHHAIAAAQAPADTTPGPVDTPGRDPSDGTRIDVDRAAHQIDAERRVPVLTVPPEGLRRQVHPLLVPWPSWRRSERQIGVWGPADGPPDVLG